MKISFIGAGAIGSLFGGILKREGVNVLLVGRQNHVDAIRREGLSISGIEEFNVKIDASSDPLDAKGSDLIVITTKAYDTKRALLDIKSILDDKVIVMSLQNGAGNIEEISKFVGNKRTIGATTGMGAFLESPGKVQFRGKGNTVIGPISKENTNAKDIVNLFNDSGIKTELSYDIKRDIWSKVVINSAINTLATIFEEENGILLDNNLLEIVRETINEGKKVLEKDGICISEDIFEKTLEIIKNTSRNINSTLADLRKGNRTEIDYISGKIVEIGERYGIPTPYNKTLMNMIKYKESR